MQYIIKAPRHINTSIKLPASKSISNRALIIHAQTGGSIVPENLMPVFQLNPMTSIITAYRDIMYAGSVPKPETLGVAAGMGVLFLLVGFLVFGKMKRRFSEVM